MALTASPAFPQGQRTVGAMPTTANTTYTGAAPITNTVLLATAGANGSILTGLWAEPMATVTATSLQLFIQYGGTGNQFLVDSVLMGAQTLAGTTAIAKTVFAYNDSFPLRLGPSDKLYVGIGVTLATGIAFTGQITDM